jgi:hypothetical protein
MAATRQRSDGSALPPPCASLVAAPRFHAHEGGFDSRWGQGTVSAGDRYRFTTQAPQSRGASSFRPRGVNPVPRPTQRTEVHRFSCEVSRTVWLCACMG